MRKQDRIATEPDADDEPKKPRMRNISSQQHHSQNIMMRGYVDQPMNIKVKRRNDAAVNLRSQTTNVLKPLLVNDDKSQ